MTKYIYEFGPSRTDGDTSQSNLLCDEENPLLVSCRSGARSSMPGMMETILNVWLCSSTIPGLINKTGNEWFVYDAYRRLIMMYSDVVYQIKRNSI